MTHWFTLLEDMGRAAIFAALFVCVPAVLAAEDVTVKTHSGALSLTGRVIGYDGQFLQIETEYGPLTLDYANVDCLGTDCPDAENYVPLLRISGATQMGDVLLPALIDAFARSREQSTVTEIQNDDRFIVRLTDAGSNATAQFAFHTTNSDEGFADLIAREADIVMAVREVRRAEVTRAAEIGLGRLDQAGQSRIIGLDALVPVTASGQGTTHISLKDLAAAYNGDRVNWLEMGGADMPVSLHLGPVTSGQTQGFIDDVVQLEGGTLSENVVRHPTNEALADFVSRTPGALGILPYKATGFTQPLALRDACGINAVPVLTTLKTEDFPLTFPLFLYFPDRRMPAILGQFLAFLRTPEAQLVVRRAGFVDQGAIPIPLDAQGQRFVNAISAAGDDLPLSELQRMVRVLAPRTRLSTSFRFEVGSTRLDAQSRSNLLNVAQAIRDNRFADGNLMLVGFSDGRGDAAANRDLSSARAEAVRRALTAVLGEVPAGVTIETEAFGEALPMGCDDTEWGRQMNRRVELWVAQ
jgi:phosphate transport system substrate-binding protein